MTIGEFLSQILGWLGAFIEWAFNWIPRRVIVDYTQKGVHYPLGKKPRIVAPGTFWYVPNRGRIVTHYTTRFVMELEPMALETKDGIAVAIGVTITGSIKDVFAYEVDNWTPDDNMIERAKSGLRELVMSSTWEQLCKPVEEGSRLEGKLKIRIEKALLDFGVEIERCGFTDQVRLQGAHRLFGMVSNTDIIKL